MYKLNNNASISGTSLKGYANFDYKHMRELFGEPNESDGYKVSGEWVFEATNGDVFTVYDWKSTNLYDSDLPSVEEFRASGVNTFNIGGYNDASEFIAWLAWCFKNAKIKAIE